MMLVVCEGTQAPQEELRAKFFECLVKIAGLYYDYLADYMQRIFDVSVCVCSLFAHECGVRKEACVGLWVLRVQSFYYDRLADCMQRIFDVCLCFRRVFKASFACVCM